MRAMRGGCGMWAQECAPVLCCLPARARAGFDGAARRTTRRGCRDFTSLAGSGLKTGLSAHLLGCGLRATAKFGRRARSIREKIIGRSMCGLASWVEGRHPLVFGCRPLAGLVSRGGVLALLHQPARQHGGSVFFQPGIQQLSDLLAEIGRVAEPRELVTLQGIPRRREKELPGRLGLVIQGDLQGKRRHITTVITKVNNTHVRNECGKLWKSLAPDRELRGCAAAGLGEL